MRVAILGAILIVVAASLASAQAAGSSSAQPRVRASVDRTAVWIGDRVTYTIEIACPRGIDVVEDDLSKDKVKLDGFDLVAMDNSVADGVGEAAGERIRTFRYVLTTYRIDRTALKIAPMSVRYYVTRAGQRPGEAAPAGEVPVPGVTVAFRSMIPEDLATLALRADRPPVPRPRLFALAQPVGLALIVISIVPATVWGVALIGRQRVRRVQKSARQVRKDERGLLDAVRSIDVRSEDGRREAYSQIDALLRAHLRDVCGIAGPSLTPAEIAPALASQRSGRIPAETLTSVLAACETARYGPPDALPSEQACRDALTQAEQILASPWRA